MTVSPAALICRNELRTVIDARQPKDHLQVLDQGPQSVPHTQWHIPWCVISLGVWSVSQIITREGLCSCEDLLLCYLPARGNGKILLMFTALRMCMCVYGSGGRVMLCAPVMPEAWAALLSSSQACLPSQNVLTSGGSVCKCDVDVFGEVCVCVCGVWCVWSRGAAAVMKAIAVQKV